MEEEEYSNELEVTMLQPVYVAEHTIEANASQFTIMNEDETLGELLTHQLLLTKGTKFAGYSRAHPTSASIDVCLRVSKGVPRGALLQAIDALQKKFDVRIEHAS